ncbi:hypothetical protein D9M69_545360 [compost metagenome]
MRTRAGREQQRNQPHDHGGRGHQDRAQADPGGLLHGRAPVQPVAHLHLVGELHHQDAVLTDQPDQRHQPDLRINVDRGHAERQRDQRAADRHGHAHQDDERIAQAFVLRGQHQVDHDDGEDKGDHQRRALLRELARVRLPVVAEARGQRLRLPGQELHRVAHGDAGHRNRLEGGGVELIELRELVGFDAHGHGHDVR